MMEDLAYIQSHGGIMLTVIVIAILAITVRAVDLFVWHRNLKHVSKKAADDVGQHELNYHMEEVLHRARLSKNLKRRASDGESEEKGD